MEFDNKRPIYEQLVNYLKSNMLNGTYPPGSELPSRRNLAQELSINPNTVQRAFKALEDEGLIETGNNVKSVVTKNQQRLFSMKQQLLYATTLEYYQRIKPLSLSLEEIIRVITLIIEENGGINHD